MLELRKQGVNILAMKVVIAEPVKPEFNDLVKKHGKDWVVYNDLPKDKDEFIERVKDADIACSYFSRFDADVLSKSPKLKYLAISAVGAEYSVDMDYAKANGITVMNCPGYNSIAVAELAVGLALDICRHISQLNSRMKEGVWANGDDRNKIQISGKKITLIGYGNIGKTIHRLLGSWCKDFTIINSTSTDEEIGTAMSEGDVVFVCCALNSKTEGLISASKLKLMKKTAILVNVSRGPVVDEDALYAALKSKSIAGAGLDVFTNEPTGGKELPSSIARFTKLDNVVCLPHIAGGSQESGIALCQMVFDNIKSALLQKPINIYTLD